MNSFVEFMTFILLKDTKIFMKQNPLWVQKFIWYFHFRSIFLVLRLRKMKNYNFHKIFIFSSDWSFQKILRQAFFSISKFNFIFCFSFQPCRRNNLKCKMKKVTFHYYTRYYNFMLKLKLNLDHQGLTWQLFNFY